MALYGLQISQPLRRARLDWLRPSPIEILHKWADDDVDAEVAARREKMGLSPAVHGYYD